MSRTDRYVIKATIAPSGVGKSWFRCRYLVEEWLRYPGGVFHTNLPLRLEPFEDEGKSFPGLVAYCAKKYKVTEEEIRSRIRVIPPEVFESWEQGVSGPWEYFADEDMSGAHIAIDEAQKLWPDVRVPGGPDQVDKCAQWISTVRHTGASVEFVTQTRGNLHKKILGACQAELRLTNMQDFPIPYTGVSFGDLMDFYAAFNGGRYVQRIREETTYQEGAKKKTLPGSVHSYWMDPLYFQFYASDSAPGKIGGRSGKTGQRMSERLTKKEMIFWFGRKISFSATCLVVGLMLFYYTFFVRLPGVFENGFSSSIQAMLPSVGSNDDPTDVALVSEEIESPVSQDRRAELDQSQLQIVDEIEGRIARVIAERDSYRKRLFETKREIAASQSSKVSSELRFLTPRTFTFTDGQTYAVGEKILFGPFAKDKASRVDWRSGVVFLNSGKRLRLAEHVPRNRVGENDPASRSPRVVSRRSADETDGA